MVGKIKGKHKHKVYELGLIIIESIVLLSQRRPDTHVDIKLDLT